MGRRALVKLFIILALVGAFGFYGYSRARNYLNGPRIVITSPIDGETVNNTNLTIIGSAKNISSIYLNDRQIYTDENGIFTEKLLLARGYNIIEVSAKDKFNREIKIIRKIILK